MPQPPLEGWKEAEGELFRLLVENVADYAIFVVDPLGLVQSWNPGAERLLGYRADEILGRSSEILFTPEDIRDGVPQREMRDSLETGLGDDDRWHVRKDGSRFWSGGRMTPLRDEAGRLRGFAKIMRDRTEWKRQQEERDLAEQARRQSESRSRAIVLTALDCIIMMDHEGTVVEFNPAAESTFGYSRAEAVGRPLAELIVPPSLRERHYQGLAHYLATGEGPLLGKRLELSAVRADGREFPVELAITRIPIEGPPLFTAYLRDITDQRRSEAALRESEAAQRLLADTITQLAWMARPDGHIFWYNRRWYDYTGTTPEQMEGWGWQSVHDPAVLPSVLARWKRSLATGEAFDMVFPLRGADGRFRPFLTRINPLRDEAGRLVYWFGTNTDISEQQRAAEMSHFLADASATLAALVDYESTLAKVARLAVPFFADWCAVDMVSDDGLLRRLAVVHNDPAKIDLAHELSRRYPPRPDDPYGPPHVLRTGQPEMATEITDAVLAQSAQDVDHLRILRELGLRSYISVPLLIRAEPLGVVTFIMAESHRAYGPADLELAQDLAH